MRYPQVAPVDHQTAVEISVKTAVLSLRPDQSLQGCALSAWGQSSLSPAYLPPQSTFHTFLAQAYIFNLPLYFPFPLQPFGWSRLYVTEAGVGGFCSSRQEVLPSMRWVPWWRKQTEQTENWPLCKKAFSQGWKILQNIATVTGV